MKIRIRRDTFVAGFICGTAICFGLNYYSLAANYGGCLDCYGDFGFPFVLGDERLFKYLQPRWPGLIADIVFAFFFSTALGYMFSYIWPAPQD